MDRDGRNEQIRPRRRRRWWPSADTNRWIVGGEGQATFAFRYQGPVAGGTDRNCPRIVKRLVLSSGICRRENGTYAAGPLPKTRGPIPSPRSRTHAPPYSSRPSGNGNWRDLRARPWRTRYRFNPTNSVAVHR